MGFQEAPPLPPLNLGFEDAPAPVALDELPPLNLGFQDVQVPSPLPPLNLGFDDVIQERHAGLPPLVWGFEEIVSQAGHRVLPPLNMGFEDDNSASDQSLPPAGIRGQHGNLPPLNLGFEEPQEDGAPEPVLDVLSRAHDTMERAVEKLAEFDVEGHPARKWAQSQIQACQQMQVLYWQMVVHRKSRLGVHRMLHMLRTVGPDHVRE
jgi:hypothetical protein